MIAVVFTFIGSKLGTYCYIGSVRAIVYECHQLLNNIRSIWLGYWPTTCLVYRGYSIELGVEFDRITLSPPSSKPISFSF